MSTQYAEFTDVQLQNSLRLTAQAIRWWEGEGADPAAAAVHRRALHELHTEVQRRAGLVPA